MAKAPDVTAIITAHREGLLVGPAAQSLLQAVAHAEKRGLACEILAVLDRADETTRSVLSEALDGQARFLETDEGDPGGARNRGTESAEGRYSAFLDADDLWSENWLSASVAAAEKRPDAVHHSACNLAFGGKRVLFWHPDSETSLFDPAYLDWLNYWDAMSLARTELYRRYPFKPNDLKAGYGHEDWHWNAWTIAEGVPHKPVPGTMHFKRARAGSQMSMVDFLGAFRWPIRKGELRDLVAPNPKAPSPANEERPGTTRR